MATINNMTETNIKIEDHDNETFEVGEYYLHATTNNIYIIVRLAGNGVDVYTLVSIIDGKRFSNPASNPFVGLRKEFRLIRKLDIKVHL